MSSKQNLALSNKENLLNKIRNSLSGIAFIVFDNDKNRWYRLSDTKFPNILPGIWASQEQIQQEVKIPNYQIVEIALDGKIPQDILRIIDLFSDDLLEAERLCHRKLIQLFRVFIFDNPMLRQKALSCATDKKLLME